MEVTKEDVNRIHDRIDEQAKETGHLALGLQEANGTLCTIQALLERAEQDRSATCPKGPDLAMIKAVAYAIGGKDDPVAGATKMVQRVDTMWTVGGRVGAVMMILLVIPGLTWVRDQAVHIWQLVIK